MPKKKSTKLTRQLKTVAVPQQRLIEDLHALMERFREQVAVTVNSAQVMLYWQVGHRIRVYGKEIPQTLSAQLTHGFERGFTRSNLPQMMTFAEFFPDEQIVAALSRQLSLSHFVEIIALDVSLKRDFYTETCRMERWSVRTLRQIAS